MAAGGAGAAAACFVWSAWPIVAKFYVHQYDTGSLENGSEIWSQAGVDIGTAYEGIKSVLEGLTAEDWSGKDRDAFDGKMADFQDDLSQQNDFTDVVAFVLITCALILFCLMVLCAAIAGILVALAIAVIYQAAMTAGLGIAGAQPMVASAVKACETALTVAERAVDTAMHGLAAVLGGVLAWDVGEDTLTGDHDGAADFLKATINQGPLLGWGLLNRIERDYTANAIGGKWTAGFGGILGKRGPLTRFNTQVDLSKALPTQLEWLLRGGAVLKGGQDVGTGTYWGTSRITPEQDEDGSYGW